MWSQWGKSKCQRENPSKLSTTFLVLFTQSFITSRNWLTWLLHLIENVWNLKFELEKPSIFGKHILTPWETKNPKTSTHSNMLSCFHVFLIIFHHVGLLEEAGTSYVCIHSRFWLFTSFSSGWEIIFVIISGWVSSPTILLHFPSFSKLEIIFW